VHYARDRCYVPFNIETSEKEDKEEVQPVYELPDGQVIKVRNFMMKHQLCARVSLFFRPFVWRRNSATLLNVVILLVFDSGVGELQIGPEKFRAGEVLFNPSLIGQEYVGIHQTLVNSINKCDIDVRRTLYSEIVLAGGSTLFTGFGDRLLSEVRKLAPRDTKVRIFAPRERVYVCTIDCHWQIESEAWKSKEG
jgi:actin-related protein